MSAYFLLLPIEDTTAKENKEQYNDIFHGILYVINR